MIMSRFRRPARSRGRTTARLAVAALLAAAAAALPAPTAQAAGSVVKVTGSRGAWQLTVDGAPYTVKGLTWGPSVADAGQYMPDVKSMGVNTIRTWGTDATTKPLLDTAAAHGIKVIAGFWLQPGGGPGSGGCVNYQTDTAYKNDMLAEFPKWVEAYKDHEGVLMWNVGNESVLGLQNCYSGDELEQQRDAYTTFVNEIAEKIHAVDPNHPVTSTDAWTGAWPYYKKNAPDLDLYAVNSYDAVCDIRATWESGGYDKPYIVTEGGPAGEWEVPDDANGVPDEPTDVAKAAGYRSAWDCVQGHPGVSLGATLFHYGTEYDFGGVWFNLLPAGQKRLSYYAVKEAYGADTSGDNTPPVISDLSVDNASAVEAGKPFTLRASVSDPDGDALTHQVLVNSKYIDDSGQLTDAGFTDRGDGSFEVTAPDRLGVWKVYLKSTDGKGNVGIETKSFKVVPPQAGGVNLASGKPAEASSFQPDSVGCPCPAANAVDGSFDTRWASEWADRQWIQVDLGATASFDHVQLAWEAAYAKAYTIQTSENGQDWNTVHTETAGNGGIDDIEVAGNARYVRVSATERGTPWGYSLYEFGVYRS
ncbi:discoidin domain-containing protein [Streptomyces sp. TRM75563]|uniref:discoidin domain-containing protein n=1 Tax=Streptomyces sp. TRM75563 TaxID=2817418 RepID=UPI001F61BF58|nr:discoidin domain-containing protein [Streptomyces sp. TRM75563]MCI4042292.1 discoidin domain-containing protein [Streptomyces sp. TRM75563]